MVMTFASRDMLGSILPLPIGIEGLLCTAGLGLRLNCLQSLGRVTVEARRSAARRPRSGRSSHSQTAELNAYDPAEVALQQWPVSHPGDL